MSVPDRLAADRLGDIDLQATPFAGFKYAKVVVTPTGEPGLAPLFKRPSSTGGYETDAWAVCEQGHAHRAPERSCCCGFYAVRTLDDLHRLGRHDPGTYVLDVSLAGHVVEHEHGYRAAFQRVEALEVPAACHRCGAPTTALARFARRVVPACARHARRGWSIEAVEASLGCPIRCTATPDRVAVHIRYGAHLRAAAIPAATFLGAVPAAVATASPVAAAVAALFSAGLAPASDEWVRHYLSSREISHSGRRGLYRASRVTATFAGLVGMCLAVLCAVALAPTPV